MRQSLGFMHIGANCQRCEDSQDDECADDTEPEISAYRTVIDEVSNRGDEVRNWIDIHKPLQPAWHGIDRYKRIR